MDVHYYLAKIDLPYFLNTVGHETVGYETLEFVSEYEQYMHLHLQKYQSMVKWKVSDRLYNYLNCLWFYLMAPELQL